MREFKFGTYLDAVSEVNTIMVIGLKRHINKSNKDLLTN